jgi:ribosomal protein S12 methylthiotransferase accessory factor
MNLKSRTAPNPVETIQKARRLIDDQVGVIRCVFEAPHDPGSPMLFGFGSLLADTAHYGVPHTAPISGSTSIVRERALVGAIGEAVERYSAAVVPYEEIEHFSYRERRNEAIDPRSLVLYSAEQYRRSAFPFTPFDEQQSFGWVMGYSLTRNQPLLVPAQFVYMPYRSQTKEPLLTQMITTGLACGTYLEDAILSAICEVVERDAVMSMWLRRLSLPRVVCDGTEAPVLRETVARFARTQYRIDLIDVTTDIGIPAIVAVARTGRKDGPAAIFASKGSLDPQVAVTGALDELAQCIMWVNGLMRRRGDQPLPSLADVSSIDDHVMWATDAQRLHNVEFMWSSECERDLSSLPSLATKDVLEGIHRAVSRLAARGLEVIVVDVTPDDIREVGLSVARVIIPGAQPLYFGYGLERIADRVVDSALSDGDRAIDRDRVMAQLNHWPHPFP